MSIVCNLCLQYSPFNEAVSLTDFYEDNTEAFEKVDEQKI